MIIAEARLNKLKMKTRFVCFVGALMLPAVMSAGSIAIGSSADVLTFTPPDITLPGTISSGPGSNISGVPVTWNFTTTLNGTNPIFTTGVTSPFAIDQNGATITFHLTDGLDVINANVALVSATNTSGTVGGYTGDFTDISGVLTYTAGTTIPTPGFQALLLANLGIVPSSGLTSQLDLFVSCGTTTVCVQTLDPTGTILAAAVSSSTASAVPEPGTMSLLGFGLAAAVGIKRRWLR